MSSLLRLLRLSGRPLLACGALGLAGFHSSAALLPAGPVRRLVDPSSVAVDIILGDAITLPLSAFPGLQRAERRLLAAGPGLDPPGIHITLWVQLGPAPCLAQGVSLLAKPGAKSS
jgi:hypothetical protein